MPTTENNKAIENSEIKEETEQLWTEIDSQGTLAQDMLPKVGSTEESNGNIENDLKRDVSLNLSSEINIIRPSIQINDLSGDKSESK